MKQRKGFTLIELLIVVAILVILAGLIYAVLALARERVRINYCVNNLKQIGAALHMYAQDYNGFVPPYTNVVCAGEECNFILPNADNPMLLKAAFLPYAKDKQIWHCPNDPFAGKSTREPPKESGPPTWRGFMWNSIDHKVTSYKIPMEYAAKGIAPVHIDFPPPVLTAELVGGPRDPRYIWRLRWDEPLTWYALDYTHSDPYKSHWVAIRLFLDGSTKVEIER